MSLNPQSDQNTPQPESPGEFIFDATDANFEQLVVERSRQTPVIVDLWAPWCGPCKQLGPLLEAAVTREDGQVLLAKVNVDDNPQTSAAFGVQSIPAVHGLYGGRVVDGFIGARGQADVDDFVQRLLPSDEQRQISGLLDSGDEASLREVLELDPPNEAAIIGLAELLVSMSMSESEAPTTNSDERATEALALLERIPDSTESRRIAAMARTGGNTTDDVEGRLDGLLELVRDDPDARQQFLDILELLGPQDPRTAGYRKALTTRLY